MHINFSKESLSDLNNIRNYISYELQASMSANKIISNILKSCNYLSQFPYFGKSLNAILNIQTNIKYIISNSYFIFYILDNDSIKIIRILSSKTNYLKIITKYL